MFKKPNYTNTPNDFFDEIAPILKEGELRVLLVMMRQTFGWGNKTWDRISISQLMKKTGMERKAVIRATATLSEKKLLTKHKEGAPGCENSWYSLVVENPSEFQNPIDDSNSSYQYPKDTPPSILKIPTKETITKEKETLSLSLSLPKEEKKAPSQEQKLCDYLHTQILKIKPDFSKKPTERWLKSSKRLLAIRSPQQVHDLLKWALEHEFWASKILSPEGLLKNLDQMELQKKTPSRDRAHSKEGPSQSDIEKDALYAEQIEKKYRDRRIVLGYNYIEFDLGIMGVPNPHMKFGSHAFKEQVESILRKMGLLY